MYICIHIFPTSEWRMKDLMCGMTFARPNGCLPLAGFAHLPRGSGSMPESFFIFFITLQPGVE